MEKPSIINVRRFSISCFACVCDQCFEIRKTTTFLMFTMNRGNSYHDQCIDTLNRVVESYRVPQADTLNIETSFLPVSSFHL